MDSYFIMVRKMRAISQDMKITYFNSELDNSFSVGILGNRKLPYIIHFKSDSVKCSCPDFIHRNVLCKHIYFIINLSKNSIILNDVSNLTEIYDKIPIIKQNLISVIDQKKLESSDNNVHSTVSIERDDCCSICMSEFENKIEKCKQCSHVFHNECVLSWWNLPSSYGSKGKCPYCRDPKGLEHILKEKIDPWSDFVFNNTDNGTDNVTDNVIDNVTDNVTDNVIKINPQVVENEDAIVEMIREIEI